MPASDHIRTLTCARQRLDRGEACVCQCFGRGADLGWLFTIECGGEDRIEWIQPATRPGEGVGYDRSFNCDTLKEYFPSMLEYFDNERKKEVGAVNCFDWVNSFFTDNSGTRMDKVSTGRDWVPEHASPVTVPPGTFQAGDIIIFKGQGTSRPGGQYINHVGIATGFGDEVSQLWHGRDTQQGMIERGTYAITADEAARPADEFYVVTRDSLSSLITKFTAANGTKYVFSPFEVWRINDTRQGNFDELVGCP